ncbi:MAG TPA: PQQ-dependent sugar dehydrogenase [Kofleriaceae bacterium]|nr:PQQ-dependent sugar dehydrogenase [Kofleriaceae bacterium]
MRDISIAVVLVGLLSGCGKPASGPGRREEGKSLETRAANAPDQKPAFPGQTRAPYRTEDVAFETRVIAKGLEHPWSVAFLPEDRFLVTERPGRLRIVRRDGTLSPPLEGVPRVDARDQGGLLDVALDPAFSDNGVIFLSYAEPRDGGNGTAVARARLAGDRLEDVHLVIRTSQHPGGCPASAHRPALDRRARRARRRRDQRRRARQGLRLADDHVRHRVRGRQDR